MTILSQIYLCIVKGMQVWTWCSFSLNGLLVMPLWFPLRVGLAYSFSPQRLTLDESFSHWISPRHVPLLWKVFISNDYLLFAAPAQCKVTLWFTYLIFVVLTPVRRAIINVLLIERGRQYSCVISMRPSGCASWLLCNLKKMEMWRRQSNNLVWLKSCIPLWN